LAGGAYSAPLAVFRGLLLKTGEGKETGEEGGETKGRQKGSGGEMESSSFDLGRKKDVSAYAIQSLPTTFHSSLFLSLSLLLSHSPLGSGP